MTTSESGERWNTCSASLTGWTSCSSTNRRSRSPFCSWLLTAETLASTSITIRRCSCGIKLNQARHRPLLPARWNEPRSSRSLLPCVFAGTLPSPVIIGWLCPSVLERLTTCLKISRTLRFQLRLPCGSHEAGQYLSAKKLMKLPLRFQSCQAWRMVLRHTRRASA